MSYNKYNDDDVFYCNCCLSLMIVELPDIEFDICGSCGNADIKKLPFFEWEELYQGEKGQKFIEDKDPSKKIDDK